MKVSFENPDKINGLLTITVEEDDYKTMSRRSSKSTAKEPTSPASALERLLWA